MKGDEFDKRLLLEKIAAQRKLVASEVNSVRGSVSTARQAGGYIKDAVALAGPIHQLSVILGGDNTKLRRLILWGAAGLAAGVPAYLAIRRRRR